MTLQAFIRQTTGIWRSRCLLRLPKKPCRSESSAKPPGKKGEKPLTREEVDAIRASADTQEKMWNMMVSAYPFRFTKPKGVAQLLLIDAPPVCRSQNEE